MGKLLCLLGFHSWGDYAFDHSQWWAGKGVVLKCKRCPYTKAIRTVRGLAMVRKLINKGG